MAITLDVITKVVEGSLRDSSTRVEKHFTRAGEEAGTGFSKSFSKSITNSGEMQKAFDKAADAAGKLRVEQQKLNELQEKGAGGAKLIAQQERLAKVHRETERAVRDTADAFQKAERSAGGMLNMLSNVTAGTRFGGLTSQVSSFSSSLSGIGTGAAIAVGGITAIAVGAVAAANKLYDMGKAWDNIADGITAKTGKVGSELQSITDQVAKVSTTTAATQQELGNIAGSAVQSLRLSGDQLGAMIKQIAELNNLTGDPTNVRSLGMVFRMFKVEAQDQVGFLDQLYAAFQTTGVSVNDLIATLEKGGTVLSGFGMSATQAASVIGLFGEAGVPADQAMRGLTTAFKQLNAAGKDPVQGLKDMVTQIKALADSGNIIGTGGARDLAEKYFGKGFGPILQSIIDSRFEIDKLPASLGDVEGKIKDATNQTADFEQTWQKLSNNFSTVLRPAAQGFFDWMNDALIGITTTMVDMPRRFVEAWNGIETGNSTLGKWLSMLGITDPTGGMVGGGGSFGGGSKLSNVPSGRYVQAEEFRTGNVTELGDLSKGLGDCTSAIEDLINMMDGQPTAGRSMATDNADTWLVEHGFIPNTTGANVEGAFNVGFNDSHMQATLPDGRNFNWGDNSSAAAGGIAGGGAFDPTQGFTKHYYRPAGAPVGVDFNGAPVAPSVGPGITPPSSPSIGDFPSPDQIGAANPNMNPVQMVPSPFGPQYSPVPSGSTPGYDQYGKPGTYLPDPKRIETATKGYENAIQNAKDAADVVTEAQRREKEILESQISTSEERAKATKDRAKAEQRRDELIEQIGDAQDQLAEAKLGTFREAQKAQKEKAKANGMDNLADDFGLGEGLPGLAKWLTTFAMNLAMAPMTGQLGAIAAQSPYQGGHGMLGTMGANNMAAGLTPLGLAPGSAFMPGATALTPGASAMGPAPIGGGIPSTIGSPTSSAALNANPGLTNPGLTPAGQSGMGPQTSMPAGGAGGGGFGGMSGSMLSTISSAAALAAPALDAMAPGAGQAAQTGIQIANRTAAYAGQVAGIGVGGLLETFLPHDSAIADPGKSWVGKIAGGVAGARPALPNTAGGQGGQGGNPAGPSAAPQTPEQAQALQAQNGGGQAGGPMVHVENMINQTPDGGQSIANQIGRLQMSSYASGMPR